MASRSGRRRVDHRSPLVDLEDVFADDALVDAIAASPWGVGCDIRSALATDGAVGQSGNVLTAQSAQCSDPLTELFGSWRQELAGVPMPDPPAARKAVDAIGKAKPPRRSHRPALAIAAAIAALLVGSTFVGSRQATEDSALWNITAMLWPDRVESVASRNRVNDAIDAAQTALAEGRPQDAQAALLEASFQLGRVDDVDGRPALQSSLEDLWKQATPAGESTGTADGKKLVAGATPSSTAHSSTGTLALQVAAQDQPDAQVSAPSPTDASAAAAPAAADLPSSDGGAAVAGSGTSGGGTSGGGTSGGGTSGGGTTAGGSTGSGEPAAVKPVTPGDSAEAASETPASAASTLPPTIPIDPSANPPIEQPPTNGSTESAPAPTPSDPTSTVAPSVKDSAQSNVGGETAVAPAAADSLALSSADSTAVIPTP